MSGIGSRPEDLVRLSEMVQRVSSDLDRARITYGLDITSWIGLDAGWFRNRWHGSGAASLRASARTLSGLSAPSPAQAMSIRISDFGGIDGPGHRQGNYRTIIRYNSGKSAPFSNDLSTYFQVDCTVHNLPASLPREKK